MATDYPDTYASISTDKLISVFADAPARLSEVVQNLDPKQRTNPKKAGKWSIQEITLHLTDAEIMGAARIRQAYAEPGSHFAVYEQDDWARAFDYQHASDKSFFSAIMLFDALRLATGKIFRASTDDDWQKSGIHPEWGELSLRQLLEIYADHGERHIGQILELRELLGDPIDYPLLLPERLY